MSLFDNWKKLRDKQNVKVSSQQQQKRWPFFSSSFFLSFNLIKDVIIFFEICDIMSPEFKFYKRDTKIIESSGLEK